MKPTIPRLNVPDNTAAPYYINLIQEARYRQKQTRKEASAKEQMVKVEDAWESSIKRNDLTLLKKTAERKIPWRRMRSERSVSCF